MLVSCPVWQFSGLEVEPRTAARDPQCTLNFDIESWAKTASELIQKKIPHSFPSLKHIPDARLRMNVTEFVKVLLHSFILKKSAKIRGLVRDKRRVTDWN